VRVRVGLRVWVKVRVGVQKHCQSEEATGCDVGELTG
jgi:hypothetical protein